MIPSIYWHFPSISDSARIDSAYVASILEKGGMDKAVHDYKTDTLTVENDREWKRMLFNKGLGETVEVGAQTMLVVEDQQSDTPSTPVPQQVVLEKSEETAGGVIIESVIPLERKVHEERRFLQISVFWLRKSWIRMTSSEF